MIKHKEVLINEIIFDSSIICYLYLSKIYTVEDLINNINCIEKVRGIGTSNKLKIYNALSEFLNGTINITRTNIDEKLKTIYISELGFNNTIINACRIYNINTFEDLHYIIDRDLISTYSLLKPHKKEVETTYFNIINRKTIIKRIFNDAEINKVELIKDRYVQEYDEFMPIMQTAFKYSGINTIGDLVNSLLCNKNIRGLGKKYRSLLIEDVKTILSKLELNEEIHKKF